MDEFQILLDDHGDTPVPTIIRNFFQGDVAEFSHADVRMTIYTRATRCL